MRTGNYYKKSLWTEEEDMILMDYIKAHGKGHWNQIAKRTGLKRCGKSCRLRWMNYLSPGVKRDNFTEEEEDLIIRLHKLLGNRWSLIAGRVPGRTDNQVKNYWNTHLCKKIGEKKANNEANHVSTNTKLKTMEVNGSSIESNSKPRCSSNNIGDTEFKVIEGTSNVIEVSDTAEPMFLDSFWDSFSVSDNYFDQLNTPGLMKFLDGYSLDLDWNGL